MLGPVACLVAGVGIILFLILVLRFHAFLALITAALAVALLSDRIPVNEAIPLVTERFGEMMGNIGVLLAMAAIIGKCLMDSGAADRIVRAFTRLFGAGRENYSLLSSGFVLSIPVFFDTIFYLLAPLARAVYARHKRRYVLIVLSAAAGGAITHALVPPTPGPIAVAEELGVSIGLTMRVGFFAAIVPVFIGGVLYAHFIDKRMSDVAPKDVLGVSQKDLEATAQKPDSELPSLFFSCLPFVLPVVLLAGAPILKPVISNPQTLSWIEALSDKNLAFFLGAILAIGLLIYQKRLDFKAAFDRLGPAISDGAVIAFITCAGGAFGKSLADAGIGDTIKTAAEQWNISLLLIAFFATMLIRIAQGSATVAMITVAGIISTSLGTMELSYNPVYLVAIIGFGATGFSWMNDSGFWIFSRMTGLNEAQTLKTWTMTLTIMSITGFLWTLLLAKLFPLI